MRVATPAARVTGGVIARAAARVDRLSDRWFAWLCLFPALLLVAVLVLPPILAVFGLSFFRIELAT